MISAQRSYFVAQRRRWERENQEAYLNDLHSQGIDIKRLRESIQQLKAGEVERLN
jgi:hypothetical protein